MKNITKLMSIFVILTIIPLSARELLNSSQLKAQSDVIEGWQKLSAPGYRATDYKAIESEVGMVLSANSRDGASGYWLDVNYDLLITPILKWRWRIDDAPSNSRAGTKEGDDFAARVFVGFDHQSKLSFLERTKRAFAKRTLGRVPPRRSIIYVWQADARLEAQLIKSPYNDHTYYVVLAASPLGSWHWVERNVLEDYRAAFAEEPFNLMGIGIMTDTDNGKGEAQAFYSSIEHF